MAVYQLPFPESTIPRGGYYGSWILDTGAKRANMHHGTDFAPGRGADIKSVADGVVVAKGISSSVGCWTEIKHDDGIYATYCHSENPSPLSINQRVARGAHVNLVGARGNVTGPHLHLTFATVKGGGLNWVKDFDCVPYIKARLQVTLGPQQRQVLATLPVRRRSLPTTQSPEAGEQLPAGEIGNFNGWTYGENVTTNGITTNIWFRGISGNWFWAGGFTDRGTHDFTFIDLAPTQPEPDPGSVLDPTAPWKKQTPDTDLATWVGSPNYNRYPSSPDKDHITFHWMVGTLEGTDAHFQNPGEVINGLGTNAATNYGCGPIPGAIHQYVLEKDYQHGDGNRESNTHGISIEHEGGLLLDDGVSRAPVVVGTLNNSARLCADIASRKGWDRLEWMVNVFPHDHWIPTTCPGTLDYQYIIDRANLIINGLDPDNPPVEPDPGPDPEPPVEDKNKGWIGGVVALLLVVISTVLGSIFGR